MLPDSFSIEDRAREYERMQSHFEALGVRPFFSDQPHATIWLPIAAVQGYQEVLTLRALGRELIKFADKAEGELREAGQMPHAPAPGNGGDRVAQLEALVHQLTAQIRAGGPLVAPVPPARAMDPPPYPGEIDAGMPPRQFVPTGPEGQGHNPMVQGYTVPTAGERRPDPIAPRILSQ